MYNISPREGERYFLRTLLLHRSGIDSFNSLLFVDGVQYSTSREACYALGLLANDAEWMRCLEESYSSCFEPLTTVFAIILAFSDPSNPRQLWSANRSKFIDDIRKRHKHVPEALSILQTVEVAAMYALKEVQDTLHEINMRFHLDHYGLKKRSDVLIDRPESANEVNNDADELRKLVSDSVERFIEG